MSSIYICFLDYLDEIINKKIENKKHSIISYKLLLKKIISIFVKRIKKLEFIYQTPHLKKYSIIFLIFSMFALFLKFFDAIVDEKYIIQILKIKNFIAVLINVVKNKNLFNNNLNNFVIKSKIFLCDIKTIILFFNVFFEFDVNVISILLKNDVNHEFIYQSLIIRFKISFKSFNAVIYKVLMIEEIRKYETMFMINLKNEFIDNKKRIFISFFNI